MIVEELIDELEKFPKDTHVYSWGEKVESVKIFKDFPLGDPANLNCEYDDVVVIE